MSERARVRQHVYMCVVCVVCVVCCVCVLIVDINVTEAGNFIFERQTRVLLVPRRKKCDLVYIKTFV